MMTRRAREVVDRVYLKQIPAMRESLERLKGELAHLSPKTNWAKLRADPLLIHARRLEQLLDPLKSTRLTKGVRMFHSDLVYLQENVSALEQIVKSEKISARRKGGVKKGDSGEARNV
jgi:hypothetical protein